jgi:hypothetical protein
MTFIVTTETLLSRVAPPALPVATNQYERAYQDQLNNILRLYFNRLSATLNQLQTSGANDGSIIKFPHGAFHQDGHTTLTANIGNGTTTPIPVVSTAGFLNAGGLIIENEVILYTGKTATTFTGITRGAKGTSSSAHLSGTAISEAQIVPLPSAALSIAFTVTDASYDVELDPLNNTHVVFLKPGYFNIQFSAQLLNFTTSEDNVVMWFRKDGVDISNTAGVVTVPSKHGSNPGAMITSWNLIVDVLAGQYIELMVTSDSGNTVIATYPPSVVPGSEHPASPSVILTASFVSALP